MYEQLSSDYNGLASNDSMSKAWNTMHVQVRGTVIGRCDGVGVDSIIFLLKSFGLLVLRWSFY